MRNERRIVAIEYGNLFSVLAGPQAVCLLCVVCCRIAVPFLMPPQMVGRFGSGIWRGRILYLRRRSAAVLLTAVLSACAATNALEPQHTQLAPKNARIFIMRPGAIPGAAVSATVKINGAEVGSVANNSYLSVDRPPGRYKIDVSFPLALVANEHEAQVEAGRSYYFVLNMKSVTTPLVGGGFFFTMQGPAVGRPVEQPNIFAGSYLAELDANAGPAALSRLKAP